MLRIAVRPPILNVNHSESSSIQRLLGAGWFLGVRHIVLDWDLFFKEFSTATLCVAFFRRLPMLKEMLLDTENSLAGLIKHAEESYSNLDGSSKLPFIARVNESNSGRRWHGQIELNREDYVLKTMHSSPPRDGLQVYRVMKVSWDFRLLGYSVGLWKTWKHLNEGERRSLRETLTRPMRE